MTLSTRTASSQPSMPAEPAAPQVRLGTIVTGSLVAGLAAAVALPFLPVATVDPDFSTAMVLLGFALGWTLLTVLSTWLTDSPQRWAVAPATFMAVAAVVVLVAPADVVSAAGWLWPPALVVLVAWTWTRARRAMRSRAGVWLLNPVLVILVLLAVGGGYEQLGRSTAPAVAMHGGLVDVGPYRLHLECHGSGSPTVVLEPGAAGSAASMGLITPAVARTTRVCVYDRAGRGWSDPAAVPPDGAQVANDLHTLLHRAHVPGPYVLAGHSFGGLYIRTYAAAYPEDVAGLVLIDSTPATDHAVPRPSAAGSYSALKHTSSLLGTLSRLGLGRLIAATSHSALAPGYRNDARATASTGKEMAGIIDEYGVAGRSAAEAGALETFGSKPLIVLTASRGSRKGWMAQQDEMATLSTNSDHRVEAGATHASFVDDPTHAASVVRAIHDVVAAVRSGKALAHR